MSVVYLIAYRQLHSGQARARREQHSDVYRNLRIVLQWTAFF